MGIYTLTDYKLMIIQIKYIKQFFVFCCLIFLVIFSFTSFLYASQTVWTEVANTNNEKQFIDINSIKYNSKGNLSVITKYSEINPEDHITINTSSYLMAVDCENRLFSKLSLDSELKQVEKWEKPLNNKLIKKTIISSCSY